MCPIRLQDLLHALSWALEEFSNTLLAKLPLYPWDLPHLPMPLTTQTEITLEGFDGAVTSVGCSLWQDRTLWALWITDGATTWQWKTQQRKSCNTCDSDRTPRQGMDSQQMHLVLQAPTHMPTLTHYNACPLWLEVGQISILYNWFEESSNNSS